jgi:hypothetical protein
MAYRTYQNSMLSTIALSEILSNSACGHCQVYVDTWPHRYMATCTWINSDVHITHKKILSMDTQPPAHGSLSTWIRCHVHTDPWQHACGWMATCTWIHSNMHMDVRQCACGYLTIKYPWDPILIWCKAGSAQRAIARSQNLRHGSQGWARSCYIAHMLMQIIRSRP